MIGARGDNGSGPKANIAESAENGEGADGSEPAPAGRHSGHAWPGPLIAERLSGKITGLLYLLHGKRYH